MARLRAVTFDLNGTLIHSPRLGEIYAEVLGRHGLPVDASAAERTVRLVWQEFDCLVGAGEERFGAHPRGARGWWFRFIDRVCAHLGAERPSSFAKTELYDRFARADAWEIYPEVPAVLAQLREQGLKLGIISNWDDRLPLLFDRLGLAAAVDAVVYSQEVRAEKPACAIFRRALTLLAAEPEASLHVGDRPLHDVEGARAAGMRALRIDRAGGGDLRDLRPLVTLCAASGCGDVLA